MSIDGNVIPNGALDISGPGIYQFDYTSSLAETATLSAYVTDSALYEAQDAVDVPFELPADEEDNNSTYVPTPYRTMTLRVKHAVAGTV